MKFILLPVLDIMIGFYQQPATPARFQKYLSLLKGNTKDDLALPIAGFNPMGKAHVLAQLLELKTLGIESIIESELADLNNKSADIFTKKIISVSFNLSDDLRGGWTEKCSTDFDSKFKINAFVSRNMCVPYFWTSEKVTEDIVRRRVQEYCYRTIYWQEKKRPQTLAEMVLQERFVQQQMSPSTTIQSDAHFMDDFFETNRDSDNPTLLLNFWYGDEAVKMLGHQGMGVERSTWPILI